MKLSILNPTQKLKASLLKQNLKREQIELFKSNLKATFTNIIESEKRKESEEHLKAIVRDFLLDTYYKGRFAINTKERMDLVIHIGNDLTSYAGVILETKQPSNKSEMISAKSPNSKAFQQLLSYYLHERFTNDNKEIKHLIITNIYEWYIFDASDFERYFFENKKLRDSYKDWSDGNIGFNKTDWFYKEVINPHLEKNLESIECTYFNLKDYEEIINNDSIEDDDVLLDLYKILSPEHLLKKQVANDSNSLNKQFYAELLHILGLEEVKEGSKKTIKRCAKPNEGSILENTLAKLKTKARDLSETEVYDTALELTITWLNRILFLKLLEGQLIKYNNNPDSSADSYRQYAFLNYKKIDEYDILEELFFEVLAVNYKDRPDSIQKLYANIPYLNSSLFEETELERKYFGIGLLKDRLDIPIYSNTVLTPDKNQGQVKGSSKRTLEYLFEFLEAYDFSDDTKGKIKENSKSIINASVLGLIFEKINGYKDGSFFTPSFITMYMCRESIRRAVVQKFNDTYGWKCEEFTDLKNEIKSIKKKEASDTLNTLRICDPAVGSGHFLVSALNELITIKQDLKILIDSEGVDLSEYTIDIENDELVIKDERGIPYSYQFQKKESRRIQETLFREKQTIIENCLFGVDINPKSVMICRLRLWIELLKNAYYTESSKYKELETLPNIDINIKCGNSLISRFEVKDSVFESIPNFQTRLKEYTTWVQVYKGERDKSAKAQLVKKIDQFKSEFKLRDKRTDKVQNEIDKVTMEILKSKNPMFPLTDTEKAKVKDYEAKLEKLTQEKKDIESNPIYQNAFEWRFEFPEVLDDKGGFVGFDVVIGNPPYVFGGNEGISNADKEHFKNTYENGGGKINLFTLFIEKSFGIIKANSQFSFIIPNTFLRVTSYNSTRKFLVDNSKINTIYDFGDNVFEDAVTTAIVINATKGNFENFKTELINSISTGILDKQSIVNNNYVIAINVDSKSGEIIEKMKSNILLGSICKEMIFGVVITKNKNEIVSNVPKENWKPFLEGKEIGSYAIGEVKQWLNYEPKLLHRARTKEVFEVPEKILIQRITGGNKPLKAAYDNQGYYNKESINNIILNDNSPVSTLFILALLNSKLINWFYSMQFTNESNLTVNLSKTYLSQIPIALPSKKLEGNILKVVDKILSQKQKDPKADTSDLEAEINKLVYELYGLSEEEIKVVEG